MSAGGLSLVWNNYSRLHHNSQRMGECRIKGIGREEKGETKITASKGSHVWTFLGAAAYIICVPTRNRNNEFILEFILREIKMADFEC